MKRILMDAIQLDLDAEKHSSSFNPSPQHLRQMQSMQKNPLKWSKRKTRPIWKTMLQKAAMLLLALSLGFGAVMVSSPTARAALIRWARELYESHIVYRFAGEPVSSELPNYEITALPEGFVETERIEHPKTMIVMYENKDGDTIYFIYGFMQQGTATVLLTENADIVPVTVNSFEGEFFQSKDLKITDNTMVWLDTELNIYFNISSAYELSDILHMAESISLSNMTK